MNEKLKQWQMISRALCTLDYHSIKLMDILERYFINIHLLLGLCHEADPFQEIPS